MLRFQVCRANSQAELDDQVRAAESDGWVRVGEQTGILHYKGKRLTAKNFVSEERHQLMRREEPEQRRYDD